MSESTVWTREETALWARLQAHPFESPADSLDFARRLAREQGWGLARARAAIDEYRRFCFLCCTVGEEMTPSQAVDEVWHLHLTFSRDYWQTFCPLVLGTALHHGPTRGGRTEGLRFREQYARTLAAYERRFGPPPLAFWPGSRERFANPGRIRRVDLARHLVLPRPRLPGWRGLLGLLGLLAVVDAAGALPANPLDWTAGPFLSLFAWLAAGALVLSFVLRQRARRSGSGHAGAFDPYHLAYLAGGPDRAIDAAVTALLVRRDARVEQGPLRIALTTPVAQLPGELRSLGVAIATSDRLSTLRRRAAGWTAPLRARLASQDLVPAPTAARQARIAALPPLAVAAFGAAKIAVGLSRARPVGYLIVMTLTLAGIGLYLLAKPPLRTRAGDRALQGARQRLARVMRAPTTEELAMAVALGGTAVLVGTAYADYRGVNPGADGSGGDGGGDGDGGGGGCGGCGGGD
ncbi:TIGR04222 domain-containing membrane protein [uncultured Thiodictyon sp.]|uniref:TIGR04222 domain-containing membrane protein n=1 Tax=uncultured Thiodictyon sp. TaxID=1846217 RepID=UPI0025D8871D|nr:TIGR04222 domain-containing membrane protein [uncultured Thiodictyon sp.]